MGKTSKRISEFLNFLSECEELYHIAQGVERDKDAETQDILHHIELEDIYPEDYALIGYKQRIVRKERRDAKDTQRVTRPVCEWISDNRKAIRDLKKLLGEVRKQEKSLEHRSYTKKTSVLDFLKG